MKASSFVAILPLQCLKVPIYTVNIYCAVRMTVQQVADWCSKKMKIFLEIEPNLNYGSMLQGSEAGIANMKWLNAG